MCNIFLLPPCKSYKHRCKSTKCFLYFFLVPYRASILTGRLPPRTGVHGGVLHPDSYGGLPLSEITIAEMLKPAGYSTSYVGKWHLGVGKNNRFMPTNQGFDDYFGIPYSHDMCPCKKCFYPSDDCLYDCNTQQGHCALMEGKLIVLFFCT